MTAPENSPLLGKSHHDDQMRDVTTFSIGRLTMGSLLVVILTNELVVDIGTPRQVAMLRSYATIAAMLGQGLGAPFGGLLTAWMGWRWAFLVHIPLAIVCMSIVFGGITKDTMPLPDADHSNNQVLENGNTEKPENHKPLDITGLVLLMCSILCLLMFIQLAPMEGLERKLLCLFITGVAGCLLFVGFCLNEVFLVKSPLISLTLLQPSQLGSFFLVQVLSGIATFSPSLWESVYVTPGFAGIGMLLAGQFVAVSASAKQKDQATVITTYYLTQQIGQMVGISAMSGLTTREFSRLYQEEFGSDPKTKELKKLAY
ncbi:hypothetical protein N7462_001434 [Penicillium macrosclerotiorum]|uniref:uncharacterized protein n=1 Tax=Penicillium macrosclerotiorum TaxID=303699 RepID=UPI002546B4D2|nr:uncharacterized protein N7462_001434 [Penicillium macrosclerotiorum]KAJ5692011.1 hypothetical protein N7462_001434 [Penicillium macrosclerotiorum]